MGLFDDMAALVGKGMDTADKKSQVFRLQSELSQLSARKEKALAELGREVLLAEGSNTAFTSRYADHVGLIGNLEAQAEIVRQRIDAVERNEVLVNGVVRRASGASMRFFPCPKCGKQVTLDSMYCQSCGDNLASLKARYRRCPACNECYPSDAVFCEMCGGRTIELEVATSHFDTSADGQPSETERPTDPIDISEVSETPMTDQKACSVCGALLEPGNVFCGSCGAKVQS